VDLTDYKASFDILLRDLEQLLEFVEPVDSNDAVHSHRIYALFLRTCTDFESLAKDLLLQNGYDATPVNKMTVTDYRQLEPKMLLEPVEVEALFWRPKPRVVRPFSGWSTASPPLEWYQDYNTVKHNRSAAFPRASLAALTLAIGGHFALLARAADYEWPDCSWTANDGGRGSFWRNPFRMTWPP
jgi:hypothetical protein